MNNAIEIWEKNVERVKKIFAPNLTETEFAFFVSLGKNLGANPFTREIWAVKYSKDQPAQIFLGRDFYRKKAQELPEYDGHVVDAVYENDDFQVENGFPKHRYSLKNRGKLIGAYCVVFRKNTRQPYFVFVNFDEYNRGFSNWKNMPETMIKKVAESQGLRGAFQGVFAGTYDESEQWENEQEGVRNNIVCNEKQFSQSKEEVITVEGEVVDNKSVNSEVVNNEVSKIQNKFVSDNQEDPLADTEEKVPEKATREIKKLQALQIKARYSKGYIIVEDYSHFSVAYLEREGYKKSNKKRIYYKQIIEKEVA